MSNNVQTQDADHLTDNVVLTLSALTTALGQMTSVCLQVIAWSWPEEDVEGKG